MLMQNGVDPNSISQAQFQQQLANSNPNMQKALQQQYASSLLQHHQRPGMGDKGLSNPGAIQHSSPMMTQGPDGNLQMNSDFFGATPAGAMQRGLQGNGGSGGALADYQMQLMLLEQQNKKRLMMARQEQAAGEGGVGPVPGMIGQPGFAPMSPRGSRNGQSPIMNDQMKRGTPKMSQNSPLPDGTMPGGRASPGTNSFEGVTMPPNMAPQFYPQMMNGAQGGMMRPPPGHPGFPGPNGPMNQQQMDMLRQQGMRMQNGQWAGPQGMPGQPGAQQQGQAGDNGQMRNHNMPPPQAPQAAGAGSARTQPSSPQQLAAPPTPVQNKGGKQVKGPAKEPANKKVRDSDCLLFLRFANTVAEARQACQQGHSNGTHSELRSRPGTCVNTAAAAHHSCPSKLICRKDVRSAQHESAASCRQHGAHWRRLAAGHHRGWSARSLWIH